MASGRFKITMHRGPAMKIRAAFPTYHAFLKDACLPPYISNSGKCYRYQISRIHTLIFVISILILTGTSIFVGNTMWKDVLAQLQYERIQVDQAELGRMNELTQVYNFLITSAEKKYQRNALGLALENLALARTINPSGYEVNYLLTNTLSAYCQQKGMFCEDAHIYYEYLTNNYCMDDDWIDRRRFSLGLVLF